MWDSDDEHGENRIVIIAGANGTVDKKQIDDNVKLIDEYDIIMLQLEIPIETVEYVINIAYQKKKTIILNPAPEISETIYRRIQQSGSSLRIRQRSE